MKLATTILPLLGIALSLGACGSGGGGSNPLPPATTTVGRVYDLILASQSPDTDEDGIPDDVELNPLVGTDPDDADSDHDGRFDCYEVFGRSFLFVVSGGEAGELHEDDVLLDADRDGHQAAIDTGELSEQNMVDSDGDGVFDYLEYYGYVYNWPTATFMAWTVQDKALHPEVVWYRTDPLQYSTDQDAYSDGMEVSGVRMDVAVQPPGTHPLVPAYPNIVVRLQGYTVTLNEEISYERGGSIEKEHAWSRETEQSSSSGWSTGGEAGLELGFEGKQFNIMGHYNQSWGIEGSNSTSTTVAVGNTVSNAINWNKARSYNPTAAAYVKLLLKVENCGMAPASNLVPTVNLRIGGADVVTFQQPDFQIHMLMPGETYPASEGVYWVVDSTVNGPITLTEWELKALECGAPVSIAVTQLSADVMRLGDDGVWEATGDINEYVARCESVSARLFADMGDGKFLDRRVYAGQGPTAPKVTLADATRWALGGEEEDGDWFITYRGTGGGAMRAQVNGPAGTGWVVHLDEGTYENLAEGQHPFDVRLMPTSRVQFIPPRDAADPYPTVYSAYAMPVDSGYDVVVCASDYDGIDEVVFIDRHGNETPMSGDGRGPWFFSCQLPFDYDFSEFGLETVRVKSVNAGIDPVDCSVLLIHTVVTQPPLISRIIFDAQRIKLQAKVETGGDMTQDAIAWVRLYHPDFFAAQTGEDRDGYITMVETVNWFEDPDTYECSLPYASVPDHARIVASTSGGLYAASGVADMATIRPYRVSSGSLVTATEKPFIGLPWWRFDGCDMDYGNVSIVQRTVTDYAEWEGSFSYRGFPSDYQDWFIGKSHLDVYYRSNGYKIALFRGNFVTYLGFQYGGGNYDTSMSEETANVQYLELTRDDVVALDGTGTIDFVAWSPIEVAKDDIFVFKTNAGRYGKLIVRSTKTNDWRQCKSTAVIDYVVFRSSGDDSSPPPSMAYTDPDVYYSAGTTIPPNHPTFSGTGDWPDSYELHYPLSMPAGLTLSAGSGVITGTPTSASPTRMYEVRSSNGAGSTSAFLKITVLAPPGGLAYPTPRTFDLGEAMSLAYTTLNGTATVFTISPTLPAGLGLDRDTGTISGAATVVTDETEYTVTARNLTGSSTTAKVKIEIELAAPTGLTYTVSDASYTVGSAISPNAASFTNPVDEAAVTSDYPLTFSVSPALPAGLALTTASGVIAGTPTTQSSQTSYTVTATNAAGSTNVTLTILVGAAAP